jgi:hypothetical protein
VIDQTKRDKRILHGKQGHGRFRALALCDRVEWDTTYLANGALAEYKIIGTSNDKRRFTMTDETPLERYTALVRARGPTSRTFAPGKKTAKSSRTNEGNR